LFPCFRDGRHELGIDLPAGKLGSQCLIQPDNLLLMQQVHNPAKIGFLAERELEEEGLDLKLLCYLPEHISIIRPGAIHFIDEGNLGNEVPVGLMPDGFRLRLYSPHRAKHRNRTVQNP